MNSSHGSSRLRYGNGAFGRGGGAALARRGRPVGRERLVRLRPSAVRGSWSGVGPSRDPAGEDSTLRRPTEPRMASRATLSPPRGSAARPVSGSSQTRIRWPDVGSTKTSSVRRKRGSSGSPSGSPPPGPVGAPAARPRRSGSGSRSMSVADDQHETDDRQSEIPAIGAGAAGPMISDSRRRTATTIPQRRTTSRAPAARSARRPSAESAAPVGVALGVRGDDDRGPVGDDLAHRARQLGAVEAHREDGVRAEQRRVLDEPVEGLAAGVLEQARVLVDLAAAERAEAGHQVAAETAAADDEPEDHPLALDDAMAGR